MHELFRLILVATASVAVGNAAHAEETVAANLAGNYECVPNPAVCPPDAAAFTVTQDGNKVRVQSNKGLQGGGVVTSSTTVSISAPWNMLGVVHKDAEIHWSNGTIWRKK